MIASFGFFTYAWRRLSYGPVGESPLIVIGPEDIVFDDRVVMGKNAFALTDLESIRVVGPIRDRRIRVQTKAGERRDVIRSLGKGRTTEAIIFLRESLPASLRIIEEEPPNWSSIVRGDF